MLIIPKISHSKDISFLITFFGEVVKLRGVGERHPSHTLCMVSETQGWRFWACVRINDQKHCSDSDLTVPLPGSLKPSSLSSIIKSINTCPPHSALKLGKAAPEPSGSLSNGSSTLNWKVPASQTIFLLSLWPFSWLDRVMPFWK